MTAEQQSAQGMMSRPSIGLGSRMVGGCRIVVRIAKRRTCASLCACAETRCRKVAGGYWRARDVLSVWCGQRSNTTMMWGTATFPAEWSDARALVNDGGSAREAALGVRAGDAVVVLCGCGCNAEHARPHVMREGVDDSI